LEKLRERDLFSEEKKGKGGPLDFADRVGDHFNLGVRGRKEGGVAAPSATPLQRKKAAGATAFEKGETKGRGKVRSAQKGNPGCFLFSEKNEDAERKKKKLASLCKKKKKEGGKSRVCALAEREKVKKERLFAPRKQGKKKKKAEERWSGKEGKRGSGRFRKKRKKGGGFLSPGRGGRRWALFIQATMVGPIEKSKKGGKNETPMIVEMGGKKGTDFGERKTRAKGGKGKRAVGFLDYNREKPWKKRGDLASVS